LTLNKYICCQAKQSPNTGFAAHSIRPNASHFAKPENVRLNGAGCATKLRVINRYGGFMHNSRKSQGAIAERFKKMIEIIKNVSMIKV